MRALPLALLVVLLAGGAAAAGPWDSQASAKAESIRLSKIVANDAAMKSEWKNWKTAFGKAAQGDARYATWKANMADIIKHNQKPGQTWWAGPNQWTDLTFDEFSKVALGLDASKAKGAAAGAAAKPARRLLQTAPSSYDWHAQGLTTPVKNQGGCGSCWAFATVGALEAAYKIQYGQTIDMSDQQVTSCDPYDGGCNGGWPTSAFRYVYESKITTEANYPYLSGSAGQLACDATKAALTPRYGPTVAYGYTTISSNSRTALKNAIFNYGPTVIAFMVESAFQSYRGGILSTACASTSVNHAMVAVGYNETGLYWKIRNSWGATWGEQGHIRIAMVNDNTGPGLCSLHSYGGWVPTAILSPNDCTGHCASCNAGVCSACATGWTGAGCDAPICPAGCASCSDPATCTTCADTHYSPSSLCTTCATGWTGADCTTPICRSNCDSCSSPDSCDTCTGNYALPTCSSCISGYSLSSGCTKTCLAKFATCKANADCCSNKCAGKKCA